MPKTSLAYSRHQILEGKEGGREERKKTERILRCPWLGTNKVLAKLNVNRREKPCFKGVGRVRDGNEGTEKPRAPVREKPAHSPPLPVSTRPRAHGVHSGFFVP